MKDTHAVYSMLTHLVYLLHLLSYCLHYFPFSARPG